MARDVLVLKEDVPSFKKRAGDTVLAGANNSIIVLGRDRVDKIDSGHYSEKSSGAIHMIVGRGSGDIDINSDKASVYITSKSDIDDMLDDSSRVSETSVSSVALVGDCVRIKSRNSLRVNVGKATLTMSADGRIDIEGDIRLGSGAFQKAVLGDMLLLALRRHTHPVAGVTAGPTTEPFTGVLSSNVRLS